jgi:protoheme ferro-lyase
VRDGDGIFELPLNAGLFQIFQSKVGPVKWLEPSAEAVLRTLAAQGVKRILAVPVSFVSDHIETLQELAKVKSK